MTTLRLKSKTICLFVFLFTFKLIVIKIKKKIIIKKHLRRNIYTCPFLFCFHLILLKFYFFHIHIINVYLSSFFTQLSSRFLFCCSVNGFFFLTSVGANRPAIQIVINGSDHSNCDQDEMSMVETTWAAAIVFSSSSDFWFCQVLFVLIRYSEQINQQQQP